MGYQPEEGLKQVLGDGMWLQSARVEECHRMAVQINN